MKYYIHQFDQWALSFVKKHGPLMARMALAIIFIWFGALKVIGISPAAGLVDALLTVTLPVIPIDLFLIILGIGEVAIGVLFLFPKCTRLTILLMLFHMFTTFLPLLFLPEITWQTWFVPTLEGQYIIKNVALIALAIGLGVTLLPLSKKHSL